MRPGLSNNRQRNKQYYKEKRLEALQRYGGVCACCGESHYEFLCLDHIAGGGNKHRKKINQKNMAFWAMKEGWPPIFRVLCHNCNMALGFFGYCPHGNDLKVIKNDEIEKPPVYVMEMFHE